MKICISSGHGLHIRGARGNPVPPQLDEVNAARVLVDTTAELLREMGHSIEVFHDDTSYDQDTNLRTITTAHNNSFGGKGHDLDVSVHLNCYDHSAHGVEVLYVTQKELAAEISAAMAEVGFTDRGAKYRSDLYVLNNTVAPAVLLECGFCDHDTDCATLRLKYRDVCVAIAEAITGEQSDAPERPTRPDRPVTPPPEGAQFYAKGRCSWFGGPEDSGVSPSEGLAFYFDASDCMWLLLPEQPPGTTGLARRLNTDHVNFVACRWDYGVTSKAELANPSRQALVRAKGKSIYCWPVDWGPHSDTGRICDLSKAAMAALELQTDDDGVEVIYPAD